MYKKAWSRAKLLLFCGSRCRPRRQFYYPFWISAPLCNRPLGMESGKIPNARITSSSAYNARYTAPNGRLNKPFCWIARYNNHNQWFMVDFGRTTTLRKIATQGRRDANQWVTRYKLTYSVDTLHWATYRQGSQDKVLYWIACITCIIMTFLKEGGAVSSGIGSAVRASSPPSLLALVVSW